MARGYMEDGGLAKRLLLAALAVMACVGVANAADDDFVAQEEMRAEMEMDGRQLAQAAVPARAATGASDVEKAAATKMVEDYFNGISTMKAEFSQSVSGEDFASEGTFYMKRPRQFLWQYETPVRQKIVGTGTAVYYIDQSGGKDSQVTQLPVNSGLGRIFNAKVLSLRAADLEVTEARQTGSRLQVTMRVTRQAKDDQAGLKNVKMTFDRLDNGKLQLRRAEALDTLGAVTTVTLSDIQMGVDLPARLFAYTPGVYKTGN